MSQMRIYGDTITNDTIGSRVLRTLNKVNNYKRIVTVILESKDLSAYTFDELMSSFMALEERIGKSDEEVEEKAFQVQGKSSNEWQFEDGHCGGRGQGRGHGGGRGEGWGRGRGNEESGGRGRFEGQRQPISNIQCYYCKRYGHKEDRCWVKQHDEKEKE